MEPLLQRAKEKRNSVLLPVIDVISDKNLAYFGQKRFQVLFFGSWCGICVCEWSLLVRWCATILFFPVLFVFFSFFFNLSGFNRVLFWGVLIFFRCLKIILDFYPPLILLFWNKIRGQIKRKKIFTLCLLFCLPLYSPFLDYAMLQEALRRGPQDVWAAVSPATLEQHITILNFWSVLKASRGIL